jgi:hypothetical protein
MFRVGVNGVIGQLMSVDEEITGLLDRIAAGGHSMKAKSDGISPMYSKAIGRSLYCGRSL